MTGVRTLHAACAAPITWTPFIIWPKALLDAAFDPGRKIAIHPVGHRVKFRTWEDGFVSDGLAGEFNASPDEIVAYYDTWAAANYDDDVASWGYDAPERVAELLAAGLSETGAEVLDAGCGTGRVGVALRAVGFDNLVGGDFTPVSVEAARALGLYRVVDRLDLNSPLAFDDDRFAAAVSVGVFSYLADTAATLRELLRVTRPGGVVIFTQRTDLWEERRCDELVAALVDNGACTASSSEPSPYLPGHPEFGDEIRIIYTTLKVR